jgi:hypothetical protein
LMHVSSCSIEINPNAILNPECRTDNLILFRKYGIMKSGLIITVS